MNAFIVKYLFLLTYYLFKCLAPNIKAYDKYHYMSE